MAAWVPTVPRRRPVMGFEVTTQGRAQMPHILESVELVLAYALAGAAAAAATCGLFILLFRLPARATVVTNGRQQAEKDLRGSIILNGVYTNEVKFASFRVDDVLRFVTHAGEEHRVEVQRPMSRDPAALIWYSPANPRRFTTRNPLSCFALAAGCLATAIWLRL